MILLGAMTLLYTMTVSKVEKVVFENKLKLKPCKLRIGTLTLFTSNNFSYKTNSSQDTLDLQSLIYFIL